MRIMPEEKPTPKMDKQQHAASHKGRFAPQRSSILPHNTVKLAASKATLELTDHESKANNVPRFLLCSTEPHVRR